VKAVDPNRRIFRDGFGGNKDIPDGVLDEMKGHRDVLSAQHFCEQTNEARARMLQDVKGRSK
jgi:hypothetical protein